MNWLAFEQYKQAWLLRKFAPNSPHLYLKLMQFWFMEPGR